jgi:hypothetical protein
MRTKYIIGIAMAVLCTLNEDAKAQGVWTQKANFGGGGITEARAFSIGNYGYIGAATQVLWQYDPVSDTWSQMASMPGNARMSAVGFSIGSKGYFGTGGSFNDFYEYDQPTNTWTQRANFGGSGREGALGISILGKGYIGTGGNYLNDWWEYDPVTDSWTQKANLAGPGRYHGGAFAIDNKGYVCTGFNGSFFNDLWEYDPTSNNWSSKSPLPGTTRDRPVGVAAGGRGYIVTGWTGNSALNDAWEYNPVNDTWTQLPPFPGSARYNACGFGIGNKVYVGTGTPLTSTFYEYGQSCLVQASATSSTCFSSCDGSAAVTFPLGSSTYLWSNNSTSASVSGLCPGTYTVTVTDSLACSASTTVTVTSPQAITGSAVITEPLCFGDLTGGACFVPAGGTPPYLGYLWAIGDTTSCISNVPAGLYNVTVTDASGCTGINSVTITQPAQIAININASNASCSTCPDGSASAGISGGTQPFTYQWSTGSTSAFIFGLLPGVYTFCATDSNGCQECDSATVSYASGIVDPVGSLFTVSPNPFSESLSIHISQKEILPALCRMSDIGGRVFYEMKTEEEHSVIETGSLPAGIYILEIYGNGYSQRYKVVK